MLSTPRQVRQLLPESDAELEKFEGEQRDGDAQLEQLGRSPYLSGEHRLRLATWKKLKLGIRDRMEALIAQRVKQMLGRTAEGQPSHSGVE